MLKTVLLLSLLLNATTTFAADPFKRIINCAIPVRSSENGPVEDFYQLLVMPSQIVPHNPNYYSVKYTVFKSKQYTRKYENLAMSCQFFAKQFNYLGDPRFICTDLKDNKIKVSLRLTETSGKPNGSKDGLNLWTENFQLKFEGLPMMEKSKDTDEDARITFSDAINHCRVLP